MTPAARRRPDAVALVDALPAGRAQRRAGAGRARRRAAGDRAGQPGLPGTAYATPTLWAAIQYLGPRETAPAHRHTQTAFRFVVEGEGVWTNVEGDPVAMRRGDLLLTPSWHFHEHHNTTDHPMAWIDGLDIPLVDQLDAGFFEFGPDQLATTATPHVSRNERLWGHPGLRPVGAADRPVLAADGLPLGAHRRRADRRSSSCERRGPRRRRRARARRRPLHQPDHRRDALRTIRTEMHRLARRRPHRGERGRRLGRVAGVLRHRRRQRRRRALRGRRRATCSPCRRGRPCASRPTTGLDAFRFSDDPVFEALGLARTASRRHALKLATIRTGGGTQAVRVDDDARRRARRTPTSARCCADPDWRAEAAAADGARARARRPGLRPGGPAPGEDHLRRAELPHPHPGDGPRAPRVPDAVREVRPGADRRVRRRSRCRRARQQVDWEAELGVVVGAAGAARDTASRPRRRSPATPWSTTSPPATASTARCSGCRARRSRRPPRSGRGSSPTTATGPSAAVLRGRRRAGAEGRHRRPGVRPGRARVLHLVDHHAGAG